ncbi:DUF916 domain-containing protein [Lactococcus garvieae]|uniref:Uncharacterized protein n=1 Tax=Lactococcus garvieae TaxID=1363 RepID=A0A1I4IQJ9_9LACT|nr:DUF916 domain-containing protein [Lactococcus garvieae]SFL56659.1 Protein of unknown function C-terminal [Lactococcus garvieae]
MKKIILIIFFSIFGVFYGYNKVFGDTTKGSYSIEGIPNSHQLDKNVQYFFLYEQPSEKDLIKVKINNTSSEEKHLSVKVTDANTNGNGEIDYTGTLKNHVSLVHPLTSLLKVEQSEITVPAQSSSEVTLKLTMPSKRFDGIILGGITVSEERDTSKYKKNMLVNIYSYTLGVVLTNTSETNFKKNITVILEKVGARLFDGRREIEADILNPTPYVFTNASISGTIREKKSGRVIQKKNYKKISVAPYSLFPFRFDWGRRDLNAGTYIFTGEVKDSKHTWNLQKEFTITFQQQNRINKESAFQIYIPLWLKMCELFNIVFVIVIAFLNKGRGNKLKV